MRISDWSSDVCSSDLGSPNGPRTSAERSFFGWEIFTGRRHARAARRWRSRAGDGQSIRPLITHSCHICGSTMRPTRWCERSRSEEHTSELQSLMRISYAVFCLKKKIQTEKMHNEIPQHIHI